MTMTTIMSYEYNSKKKKKENICFYGIVKKIDKNLIKKKNNQKLINFLIL